jgi:hypothetical protein
MNKIHQEMKLVQSYYGNNPEYLCKKKTYLRDNAILDYINAMNIRSYNHKSDVPPIPYYTTVVDEKYKSSEKSKVIYASKIDTSIQHKSEKRRSYLKR